MKRDRIFIVVILMIVICFSFIAMAESDSGKTLAPAADSSRAKSAVNKPLPKLVDLGSKTCIPCKKMAPILDSLREEYKSRAEVIFIDTKENRKAAAEYKIAFIPTQVFIDTTGKEVFRHVGFYPADSIVMQFKAMGVK